MRFLRLSTAALALSCLAFAVVAPAASEQAAAATEQSPTVSATTLEADYQALEARVNACPGGTCADAAAIRSDFSALEALRADLTPPSATVDALASAIGRSFGGWEEQS